MNGAVDRRWRARFPGFYRWAEGDDAFDLRVLLNGGGSIEGSMLGFDDFAPTTLRLSVPQDHADRALVHEIPIDMIAAIAVIEL